MDYNQIIKDVIELVGGESNISRHTNCITRLRVTVKDVNRVDVAKLKDIEGILGVNENGQEMQLIFGPGKVAKAREAMDNILGTTENKAEAGAENDFENVINQQKGAVKAKRTSSFQAFMSKFSNIFVPLIPGFIAAGMLAGIAATIKAVVGADVLESTPMLSDILNYLSVFNVTLLKFMLVMIGYNAATAFGGNGVLGGILGGLFLLTYGPEVDGVVATSGMTGLFGIVFDPRGGVIGVLFAAILGAKLEQFIRKNFSWDPIEIITTPIITLFIMGLFTFIVIMPISTILFKGMTVAFSTLNGNPIGAGILAGLFLPAVMMGIHQGFVPVYQGLVESQGFNSLFPVLAMAGAGQVGAALALYVKSPKESKLRKNIRGAIVPGFLGVGEPLIYGVTLPRVRPFFTAMAGGAVGGLFIGTVAMFGFPFGLNTVFGPSGLLAVFTMKSADPSPVMAMLMYLAALAVAYVAGFIFTYLWGTKNVDLD
ncbi:MAG: PTS N-acetylmuramic acid transporter subunit IIBC [Mycoplasmatales bacterium]